MQNGDEIDAKRQADALRDACAESDQVRRARKGGTHAAADDFHNDGFVASVYQKFNTKGTKQPDAEDL